MKSIRFLVIGCLISLSLYSQTSTLTVILKGNQNRQLLIDGREYSPSGLRYMEDARVTVTGLQAGRHDLQLDRAGNSRLNADVRTSFTLREGYDKTIIIGLDGSVAQDETTTSYGAGTITPMSDLAFRNLYVSARAQRGWARRNRLRSIFGNNEYSLTTAQVRQLLMLEYSEAYRLDLAKSAYHSITDQWNYRQLLSLFSSRARQNELLNYINSYYPETGSLPGTRYPMTESAFSILYENIQSRYGEAARMSLATEAFGNLSNNFTTSQARRIILLMRNERDRLELAKLVYSHITDPQNFSQIYDVLNRQSSRNELSDFVRSVTPVGSGGYGGYYSHSPMADYNFNSLYRSVEFTFGFGAKMTRLTEIFSTPGNYFTVAQAEKLIRLVSAEENRLQLAKLAYSHLTDPANFADLYDMFGSSSSVEELRQMVRTY